MATSLRISSKLIIMIAVSVVGIIVVAAVGLSTLRDNLIEDRRIKLRELVQVAQQVVGRDYAASRTAGLTHEEAVVRGKDLLRGLRFAKDDYFYAIDNAGNIVVHPSPKVEGRNMLTVTDADGFNFTQAAIAAAAAGGGSFRFRFPRAGQDEPLPKMAYATELKPHGWALAAGIYIDDVDAIFREQVMRIGAMILVALLIVVGMSLFLRNSIVKPIVGMTSAMRSIADGDTATEVPALDRSDEVGAMAKSVEVFRGNMIESARLRSEQDTLKAQAELEKKSVLGKMADDFERGVRRSLDALSLAACRMKDTSNDMSATAERTSHQAATVAAVADTTTKNVQTVAAASEELSSSIAEIGRQVSQSTKIASAAVREADRTNATVQGLSSAAQKIGDVVMLISEIASQTNLLALNATIEAARAGEAGKGFAVVATEVKSLASQTARATEEISAQVTAMQDATAEAVRAIGEIGGTIGSINEIATAIASAVEEQGAATAEIARNVQEAARGTDLVSNNISGVNAAAGQAGETAKEVLSSAEQLSTEAAALQADVDLFVANIRVA